MGTLVALYWRMSGGVVPGGILLMMGGAIAETCAMAPSTDVPGWRKTLVTDTP